MAPTPEMTAMAERIAGEVAEKVYYGDDPKYRPYFSAALAAITETTKAASNWVDDNIGPEEASAIAEGAHLK